ncbi:MAG: carbohydrate kinase family protein [Duncaniella sp.]|nr:carbohydrate kinase family protein [Duncaniella sp.]
MNKAIYIGELTLNITLQPDATASTKVGDWAVNAAVLDGRMGIPTVFIGEVAADAVGDHIVAHLDNSKVDVKSIDRYTEGLSPVRIYGTDPQAKVVGHEKFPAEPVNAIWPRIDEGDVVVFGSYMALDERNHQRLLELLKYAKARKATVIYLPYFAPYQVPRITRVMPQIFDSLELADIVITTIDDIKAIFPGDDIAAMFKSHILFYCRKLLCMDAAAKEMRFFDGEESWSKKCHPSANTPFQWYAGALAGAVRAIAETRHDADDIMEAANETAHSELAASL